MDNFGVSKYSFELQSYALYIIGILKKMGKSYDDIGSSIGMSRQTLSVRAQDPSKLTIQELQSLERLLKRVKEGL